jgi:hypothetical protein
MPARAIQVMRIIAIGTPGAEPAAALADDDVEEIAEDDEGERVTSPLMRSARGWPESDATSAADAEAAEIPDEDVAPDSQDSASAGGAPAQDAAQASAEAPAGAEAPARAEGVIHNESFSCCSPAVTY